MSNENDNLVKKNPADYIPTDF